MQVNQDFAAVRQYAQTGQVKANTAVSSASADKVSDKTTDAYTKPDTDRLELSDKAKDITKMSDADRSALVQSLKDNLDSQMSNFTNMMMKTFQKQGITAASLQGDNFWKFMASGNYTVDAKTKADAQAAISEDGYWGVKQTSQRIFDFAAAVAGDDPETMKKMQAAVEKGFKEAGVAWGGDLPSICGDTHAAVTKLFDDYYASH